MDYSQRIQECLKSEVLEMKQIKQLIGKNWFCASPRLAGLPFLATQLLIETLTTRVESVDYYLQDVFDKRYPNKLINVYLSDENRGYDFDTGSSY